jgi:hypothetical protein
MHFFQFLPQFFLEAFVSLVAAYSKLGLIDKEGGAPAATAEFLNSAKEKVDHIVVE